MKSAEVDYAPRPVLYGKYKYHKIIPNETNGAINVDNSGGQTMTFNIPGNLVFNPSKTYIKFTYAVSAATAGAYQYMPADCHPWWRVIDWSPTSSQPLVHIEDYDHYSKLALRPGVHYDDYKTFDSSGGFNRCNSLVTQNKRPDGANSSVNWEEPRFWSISGLGAALAGTLYIPLSRFIDTALAINKDIYLGQISVLTFYFKPTTQFLFTATDQYNPIVGAVAIGNALTFNITNATMYLASEQDEIITRQLIADFNEGRHEMIIPYVVKINKTTLTNQSSNGIIVRLYPKDGLKVVKILQGIFNNEYNITAGTNVNFLSTVLPAYGGTNTCYSTVNSIRRQDNDLVLGTDDYIMLRDLFTGSAYLSNGAYQDAWCFIENFAENIPKSEIDLPLENRLVGLDLGPELIWQFNVTWTAAQTVSHYTYPITLKKMIASPAGLQVVP